MKSRNQGFNHLVLSLCFLGSQPKEGREEGIISVRGMLSRKSWELLKCQKIFFSLGSKISFFQYLFRSPLQPSRKQPFQEVFTGGNFNSFVL